MKKSLVYQESYVLFVKSLFYGEKNGRRIGMR